MASLRTLCIHYINVSCCLIDLSCDTCSIQSGYQISLEMCWCSYDVCINNGGWGACVSSVSMFASYSIPLTPWRLLYQVLIHSQYLIGFQYHVTFHSPNLIGCLGHMIVLIGLQVSHDHFQSHFHLPMILVLIFLPPLSNQNYFHFWLKIKY